MKAGIAMTGELTLTGKVYPVGGIREKIIAARRYHIREILLPEGNRKDLDEIPDYVTSGIEFHFVGHMDHVIDRVFPGKKRD
jgi:ATP-dependent Lon protease